MDVSGGGGFCSAMGRASPLSGTAVAVQPSMGFHAGVQAT